MSPRLRQKACWCRCIHCNREEGERARQSMGERARQSIRERERERERETPSCRNMLPPQRDNSHQHLQTPGDKRSGSGDIKERSVSAHIYRQTDLWWNFKEIIYISPPLNWCMKFSSTMKHTHTHTLTHAHTRASTQKVYLKSNKSARAAPKQLTLKYIFQQFGECVHAPHPLFFFTSCANSFLVFEGGQYVRLISGITFWRKGSAVANTIKWQSWIFQYFKNHIPILWTNIGMFWNYIIYFLNAWFVFACMGYDINLDAISWFVLNYLLSIFWGNPNTLISEMV